MPLNLTAMLTPEGLCRLNLMLFMTSARFASMHLSVTGHRASLQASRCNSGSSHKDLSTHTSPLQLSLVSNHSHNKKAIYNLLTAKALLSFFRGGIRPEDGICRDAAQMSVKPLLQTVANHAVKMTTSLLLSHHLCKFNNVNGEAAIVCLTLLQ